MSGQEEIIVNVLQHPNCTEALISECGEKFVIKVERELVAEVVGETKVCITVHPHQFEEEWSFKDESSSHHGHDQNHQKVEEEKRHEDRGRDSRPF